MIDRGPLSGLPRRLARLRNGGLRSRSVAMCSRSVAMCSSVLREDSARSLARQADRVEGAQLDPGELNRPSAAGDQGVRPRSASNDRPRPFVWAAEAPGASSEWRTSADALATRLGGRRVDVGGGSITLDAALHAWDASVSELWRTALCRECLRTTHSLHRVHGRPLLREGLVACTN
jgi:hypothetical protein